MNIQRSTEEYMLMTLSFGGVIAVLPFTIIRFVQGEWLIGLVDAALVVGMGGVGTYVYFTRKIKFASILLSTFALTGMSIIVHLKGPTTVFWAYPTMVGVYFILPPRMAIKLTLLAALAIIPALYNKMEFVAFIAVGFTLIVNNLFAYMFSKRMQRQQEQLTLLVRRDPLTGAGNRRALDERLEEIISENKRYKKETSLVVFDVDYFKRINDNHGHAIGDQVLIKLTELIQSGIRETDCLYRFGGEEFVVVLSGANKNSAEKIAEKFRGMVESTVLINDMLVTISLGVAEFIVEESAYSWLDRADKAMYHAKESGRNQTCVARE